jgi:4-methylaminobutanoate oxidase (formaldehyde-forming)
VEDVTSAHACIGLWGPLARRVLGPLTPADLGNQAFPYMSARELVVGSVPCLALRVTYVGELGWELYCPAEFGLRLWDTIWEAGAAHGLVAGGYKAVDSLRLEKGYRVWGADIGPESDPYAAGLGFCVKLEKGDFIGREAMLALREKPASARLACLVLDDPRSVALGSEPVRVAGEVVGRVTSGGFGYTVGRSIAYAYVPAAAAVPGTAVEVEIFGTWAGGQVAAEPLFDPESKRVRIGPEAT